MSHLAHLRLNWSISFLHLIFLPTKIWICQELRILMNFWIKFHLSGLLTYRLFSSFQSVLSTFKPFWILCPVSLSSKLILHIAKFCISKSMILDQNHQKVWMIGSELFEHRLHNSTKIYPKSLKRENNLKFHSTLPRIYLNRQSHQIQGPKDLINFESLDKLHFFLFSLTFKLHPVDKLKFPHMKVFNWVKSLSFQQRKYCLQKLLRFQCSPWFWTVTNDSWIQLMAQYSSNVPIRKRLSCSDLPVQFVNDKCILSRSSKVTFIECSWKFTRNRSSFIVRELRKNQNWEVFVLLTPFGLFSLVQASSSLHRHSFSLLQVFSSLPLSLSSIRSVIEATCHSYLWVSN